MGGYKGVLTYDPELPGECVVVRPSMRKFETDDRTLGVIRCATFSQGFLNRQVIMLLRCGNVPEEVILEKFN
jgi:hypothetical protein